MKLKKVLICGVRSIEEMELSFTGNGHRILVGKNESGKSNILKALNLLSNNIAFEGKDKKELYSKDTFVRFVFCLEKDELDKVKKNFIKKFLNIERHLTTEGHTVESFIDGHSQSIIYKVGFDKKHWTKWALSKELKIGEGWYRLSGDFPLDQHPDIKEKLGFVSYINDDGIGSFKTEEYNEIKKYLLSVTLEEIYNDLSDIVKSAVISEGDLFFHVLNWKYDSKKHDLPGHVNRNEFSNDPNICIPLKNMFLLSGIEEKEIGKKIQDTLNFNLFNSFNNLLKKINKATNDYIKENWKDFKNVNLELRPDGDNIVIGIKDTDNEFHFNQRSDGFRRLTSFLLLMSTETQEAQKKQKLILIDEPETGLHPSSAKDLKNRLVELGKDNLVIYSTHSISMIDVENIENNLIVSRENENTKIEVAKEDGTSSAENIYQAIGYSIYEELKKKNILLEGYTDKKIIKSFIIDKDWQSFGICYTTGVKHINHITSILDLGNRKYFILSDADKTAESKKKELGNPNYWFTYKDLGISAITIEDFYKKDFLLKNVKDVFKQHQIDFDENIELPEDDRIENIKKIIHKKRQKKDGVEKIKKDIKDRCLSDFKEKDLNQEKIIKMLKLFLEKIKNH